MTQAAKRQAQIWGFVAHGGGGGMVQQAACAFAWVENRKLTTIPTAMLASG
jgi:hypothetical protein